MIAPYERWMVGLDLTEMDVHLIKWVNYLSHLLKPKAVYFIHIEKHFDLPVYIPHELSAQLQVEDETHKSSIQKLINEHFSYRDASIHVEVIEGKVFHTLLHWIKIKQIDFLIAGRKEKLKGKGLLPYRFSRKLSCSTFLIPEKEQKKIKKILVPVDFSEHSMLALQTALHIASKEKACSVTCFHIYNVPLGYYKTGKSYGDFAHVMKFNAIEHFQKFIAPLERDIRFKATLLDKAPAPELIYKEIENEGYDLVIIGSKGQSAGAFILLGSTTEKLIHINKACPTWVIKKKGENIGILEALGKI